MKPEDSKYNPAGKNDGSTPLSSVAGRGETGILQMLLELLEDVDLDQAETKSGRTVLSWAAERGYDALVKLLLEQAGVNPNTVDTED